MNQDRKAKIARAVKPILAKYGVRGTFSVRGSSSVVLTLSGGEVDFIGDMIPVRSQWGMQVSVDKSKMRESYQLDINPYWFEEYYITGSKSVRFLEEVIPAMKAADWYDNSDSRIDYFDTAYYYHIKVGRWDKPYLVT